MHAECNKAARVAPTGNNGSTCDLFFFYAFMYKKAFAIPEGLEPARRELMAEIQWMRHVGLKKLCREQFKSMPPVGLKVRLSYVGEGVYSNYSRSMLIALSAMICKTVRTSALSTT